MVGSGIGRHELTQRRQGRLQPGTLPEAQDGDVREPRPPFPRVDTQPLEAPLEVVGQQSGGEKKPEYNF